MNPDLESLFPSITVVALINAVVVLCKANPDIHSLLRGKLQQSGQASRTDGANTEDPNAGGSGNGKVSDCDSGFGELLAAVDSEDELAKFLGISREPVIPLDLFESAVDGSMLKKTYGWTPDRGAPMEHQFLPPTQPLPHEQSLLEPHLQAFRAAKKKYEEYEKSNIATSLMCTPPKTEPPKEVPPAPKKPRVRRPRVKQVTVDKAPFPYSKYTMEQLQNEFLEKLQPMSQKHLFNRDVMIDALVRFNNENACK